MTFRLGQKVCCIDDDYISEVWGDFPYVLPKYGEVYTVRAIVPAFAFADGIYPAIRLYEIHNPVLHYDDGTVTEIAFWIRRFRPVTSRKTDISCLKALLTPAAPEMAT